MDASRRGLCIDHHRPDRQLGLAQDVVNVECGAVAHGCPIGAPGAVLTTRLLCAMKRDNVQAQRGNAGHRSKLWHRLMLETIHSIGKALVYQGPRKKALEIAQSRRLPRQRTPSSRSSGRRFAEQICTSSKATCRPVHHAVSLATKAPASSKKSAPPSPPFGPATA
ncbi:hypothetical protein [Bradyrhizobium sp. UFLA05-153]